MSNCRNAHQGAASADDLRRSSADRMRASGEAISDPGDGSPSPMERVLGADWARLPPALQAHHGRTSAADLGHLDIEFPVWMQPVMRVLAWMGALIEHRAVAAPTKVIRRLDGDHQRWERTIRMPEGRVYRFDSVWQCEGQGRLIEYVNPFLGLEMVPRLQDGRLRYRGVRFVLKLGSVRIGFPQWLGPGVTHIEETALDDERFAMDFRMIHPWFGELYRYSGVFVAGVPLPPPQNQEDAAGL
jgi:hypothetical protein